MRMRVRAIAIFSSLFADKQNQQEKKVVVYRRGGAVFFLCSLKFFCSRSLLSNAQARAMNTSTISKWQTPVWCFINLDWPVWGL